MGHVCEAQNKFVAVLSARCLAKRGPRCYTTKRDLGTMTALERLGFHFTFVLSCAPVSKSSPKAAIAPLSLLSCVRVATQLTTFVWVRSLRGFQIVTKTHRCR